MVHRRPGREASTAGTPTATTAAPSTLKLGAVHQEPPAQVARQLGCDAGRTVDVGVVGLATRASNRAFPGDQRRVVLLHGGWGPRGRNGTRLSARAAFRDASTPGERSFDLGFRLAVG